MVTKFVLVGGQPWRGRADVGFVPQSLEASLRRLRPDYVHLYPPHFPDFETPVADTVEASIHLADRGLIPEVVVCNATADVVKRLGRGGG